LVHDVHDLFTKLLILNIKTSEGLDWLWVKAQLSAPKYHRIGKFSIPSLTKYLMPKLFNKQMKIYSWNHNLHGNNILILEF
jgi:hypothetical protein